MSEKNLKWEWRLLLADVFEKFRNKNLKNYGLCPSHYLSTSGLSWDAMFKITKIELIFIPDTDMPIFFQKGTRGAISYTSNRYSKDNNKYSKSYNPKIESKHVIYLDANNLYFMQYLIFFQQVDSNW